MNILHISPYVPDVRASHAGGVLMGRTVGTLKERNRVFVLTFCNDAKEEEMLKQHPDYAFVRTSRGTYIRKVLQYLWMPNMFALRRDREFRKKVREMIEKEKIGAVHAEYTAMGQYEWIRRKYPGVRFHLVEHDVALQSYERKYRDAKGIWKLYYGIEKKKVERYEGRYVRNADLVFTLNEKDRDLLREKYGVENARVIIPYYGIDPANAEEKAEKEEKEKTICFVGQMGRSENHEAAMRLIRIFREVRPEGWKLSIIGAHPRPELQAEESETVHVTGFVDDINKEISKAQFAVFPLTHGAGIKLKVLLAFGLGLPVVTGQVGAEGIDPEGRVIRLAETDEDYARAIRELTENGELRKELTAASRAYVRKHFDWGATEALYREIYG